MSRFSDKYSVTPWVTTKSITKVAWKPDTFFSLWPLSSFNEQVCLLKLHKIISIFTYSALWLKNQKTTSENGGFLDSYRNARRPVFVTVKHCQNGLLFALLWCLFKSSCCVDFGSSSEAIQPCACEGARLHEQTVPLGKLNRHQLPKNSNASRQKIATEGEKNNKMITLGEVAAHIKTNIHTYLKQGPTPANSLQIVVESRLLVLLYLYL